jgi:bifunctional oligoribonuclease and PAP phosphatase NrnA
MNLGSIRALLTEQNSFLLLIHHTPDGDAVASSLALALALKALGKTVEIVCADPIPLQFQFLPWAHKIKQEFPDTERFDVTITLDCGDSKRTGFRIQLKSLIKHNQTVLINIDHHPKNDLHSLAAHNFVDYNAPSTSFLIYQVIREINVPLNHKIATCLLTGLYTDTGGFKHPNTTSETLKFASLLLSYGARLKHITTHIAQPSTVGRLKLWGIALSRIQRHQDFNIISTYITHDDILKTQTTEEDIGGIAALLASIPAEVAILVIQFNDGTTQVRMRTKNKWVNLAPLATYLGGGGQKKSAGFAVRGMESLVK